MPTILVVMDEQKKFVMPRVAKRHGYTVIPAVLKPHLAEAAAQFLGTEVKSVLDVLEQCKREGTKIDGVLISDMSTPIGHPDITIKEGFLREARERLDDPRIAELVLEGLDDDEPRMRALRADVDHYNAQLAEQARIDTNLHGVMETGLLATPPSDKGTELIVALRAQGSPYKDVPIVVSYAHPDKAEAFVTAGATRVVTSGHDPNDGIAELMEELAKRGLAPAAKSPRDHVERNGTGVDGAQR